VLFDWGETLIWFPGLVTSRAIHLECVEVLHGALADGAHRDCFARASTDWSRFRAVYEETALAQLAYTRDTGREHRLEDRVARTLRGAGCECSLDEEHVAALALDLGRLLMGRTRPIEGVHEVLAALAATHRLGVVSNYPLAPIVFESLERFDLRRYFRTVVVSGAVGWVKPDARLFRQALADLGVEAGRALFVGDDLTNDMGGAKAVGLTTAWLAPGRARPPHPAIDHHLTKLTELLDLVTSPPSAPSRG
jgi:HAD superfamily hydrolase (TIGR01549 family)